MLYIAEKPELARAIVEALGGGEKRRGYYECGADRVAWCFGHMLELCQPEDYDQAFKQWKVTDLPLFFVPWRKRTLAKSKEQFAVIVGLLKEADCVVHAGDPDPEGQLLVDEILDYVKYAGTVKRILINDNTPAVVKKALANLRHNADFAGLSQSALARQRGDFFYGINMPRLYTLAAQREGFNSVLSVGRVQTPILGMIVRRDRDFADPNNRSTYYAVRGTFSAGETQFTASYHVKPDDPQDDKGRLSDPAHSQAIADAIGGKIAVVKSHEVKPGETPPPLPYNLLQLQIDASRIHGFSPDKVKDITQTLREKHRLITYNRSDSQYLSEEQHADAPAVLATVAANMPEFSQEIADADPARKSRAFDSSKVTAHHAIIPTQSRADVSALAEDERKVYRLIARAYLAQFLPPEKWEKSTTTLEVEGHIFIRTAKRVIEPGWRSLYAGEPSQKDEDSGDEEEACAITFAVGQKLPCAAGQREKKEAGPKPLYTMATLLGDLTRVAQYIRDESLRKSMVEKDKGKAGEHGGIGTPATRDVIIATLFDRGFIAYGKKGKTQTIVSTKTGQDFYDLLPDAAKFPDMTAVWHEQQRNIEHGNGTVNAFLDSLIAHIGEETTRVLEHGLNLPIEKHPCPVCSSPMMLKKSKNGAFWGCSRYPECRATLPDDGGKPGKAPAAEKIRPSVSEKHKCAHCGKGLVRRSGKRERSHFWGCSGYPECKNVYPDVDGKPDYSVQTKKEKKK